MWRVLWWLLHWESKNLWRRQCDSSDGMGLASPSLEQQGLSLLEAILMPRYIEIKFCNQWQSHISTVWNQSLSSKMIMLDPQQSRIRDYFQNLGVETACNGLPAVLKSTQFNTWGIGLSVLLVPEWRLQPCWLTCNKRCLKNGTPSHGSVWQGWWPPWGGGARLLWLWFIFLHTTEVTKLLSCHRVLFLQRQQQKKSKK